MAKNKNRPRRDDSISDELEYLRGENRELRAKLIKATRELKDRRSAKQAERDLLELANDVVKNKKVTALETCPECKAGQLRISDLPFGKMYCCTNCKYVKTVKE